MAKTDLPPPPDELMVDDRKPLSPPPTPPKDLKKALLPDPKEVTSQSQNSLTETVTNEQLLQAMQELYQIFSMKFDQLYLAIIEIKERSEKRS